MPLYHGMQVTRVGIPHVEEVCREEHFLPFGEPEGELAPPVDVPSSAPSFEMLEDDLLPADHRIRVHLLEELRILAEGKRAVLQPAGAQNERVIPSPGDPELIWIVPSNRSNTSVARRMARAGTLPSRRRSRFPSQDAFP